MRIVVIGSGGREHAILWRLRRDDTEHELFAVPGNGGTSRQATNVAANVSDQTLLHETVVELNPDFVIVGPEAPLAEGIADSFARDGIPCFGPSKAAARLESSKVFAKQLMREVGIPTAEFEVFQDYSSVERFLRGRSDAEKWVVKADGLAAGKGAYVCSTIAETLAHSRELLVDGRLGTAGKTIVLERGLQGREVSALFLCDGERYAALPAAQDYKRAFDGDEGPNTGGMGSYCPAAHLTPSLLASVKEMIVSSVLRAMATIGNPYCGVLYVGLMLTESGPQVIEFNCRFGDPETQVILPIWQGQFGETLRGCASALLNASDIESNACSVCLVLAADGYPDAYVKGIPVHDVADSAHAFTFHAGTRRDGESLVSSGGRVLNALGIGPTIADARENAYELARRLHVNGLRFRSDIALNTN